jgi:general secretion pathway protein F
MTGSQQLNVPVPRETARRIPRLTTRHVVQCLCELSDLLEAGCPLSRALEIMQNQAEHPPVQRLLNRLQSAVVNGASLADAMAAAGGHFSPVHVAMVRAAEAGGFLQRTLAHMAQAGRRRLDLIHRVKKILAYPTVLCLTALASVVFLLSYVVPRFATVYESAGADLPWATRLLTGVSTWATLYWWVGPVVVVLGVGLLNLIARNEQIRLRLDGFLLRVPLAGPLLHSWALAELAMCMALLLEGGVTVLASLKLTSRAVGNRAMRADLAGVAAGVQRGEPMGRLMQAVRRFPPSMAELISIGEESGKLTTVLGRLADQARSRFETRLGIVMSLIEPAVILMVGAVIALVVAGMLLPVFMMNTLVE